MSMPPYRDLQPGEPAPWLAQRGTPAQPANHNRLAGRYTVLCFFGSAAQPVGRGALQFIQRQQALFAAHEVAVFGVSIDPADEARGLVAATGAEFLWDTDRRLSRAFGALPSVPDRPEREGFRPLWFVLQPNLQVRAVLPFEPEGAEQARLLALLHSLPPLDRFGGMPMQAPVLLLPDIFEPAFCRALIEAYEREQRALTGFMARREGKVVKVDDAAHKRRRDHHLEDPALLAGVQQRLQRCVVPAIARAFQFRATRIERYLVGCYDAADGGHFAPHRDNTNPGTAHRRFAVSINLSDDYEGGALNFPEYGPCRYRPPAGAGVVFSCSLVHAVDAITAGRRHAFLPFLFDDAAAEVHEAYLASLAQPQPG